jgi:hypothetical protein
MEQRIFQIERAVATYKAPPTSIALRFISVAAAAIHKATLTSIALRFISVVAVAG